MSSASAWTAPARPRSASTGGWMPRTTVRRSASADVVTRAPRAAALRRLGVAGEHLLGHAEVHAERHEPGLGAVVQVALDAAQLGGRVVDRLCPRLRHLCDPALEALA